MWNGSATRRGVNLVVLPMASLTAPSPSPAVSAATIARRSWWPFIAAMAVYLLTSCAVFLRGYLLCGHHLVYPLDDTYIEMAMARSFALHGVWGITRYAFTSATSSPLFTLLIAIAFRICGVHDWIPLCLSFLSGCLAVSLADRLLCDYLRPLPRALALCAFVLLTPLFAIGTLGMEHALHLALTLVLLYLATQPDPPLPWLAAASFLLVGARYEGMALILAVTLLFAIRKRFAAAAASLSGALLLVAVYGLFSLLHGAGFAPNSILLKSTDPGGPTALVQALLNLLFNGRFLALLLAALALAALLTREPRARALLFLVCATDAAQLLAGRFGYAFRYGAYTVGISVLAVAIALPVLWRVKWLLRLAFLVCAALGLGLCVRRSRLAFDMYPHYTHAIYLQQWQMARFLHLYFPNASVAANDIGAINYETSIHCVDLVGLATQDIARAKRRHDYSTSFLDRLTTREGVQLAFVYDQWFRGRVDGFADGPALPPRWQKVATLHRIHEQDLGFNTVSVYAVDPSEKAALVHALRAFQPSLPPGAWLTWP